MKDGIFRYALGRMTVEENPLRDRQDSVLLRRELEADALTFFEEVSAEKRYQIVCRTEEALTIEEIFREAERLWGQENNALVRILIDSGEGEEEPVLGIPDVSMDRASPGMRKVLFMGNLKYLDDHPEECQVLFESGLLREGCRVDYGERLDYIRDQGLSCIGLTASVTGEELLRMREDCPLFTVIETEEDEKERPSLP